METKTTLMPAFVICSTVSLSVNPSTLHTTFLTEWFSVTKSSDMTLPYGMLLTRLLEHVRTTHPQAFSNDLYLVDHVMIPLFEKRVYQIMQDGKRPRLPTLTPSNSESSDSPSPSPHQEKYYRLCIPDQASSITWSKYLLSHEDLSTDLQVSSIIIDLRNLLEGKHHGVLVLPYWNLGVSDVVRLLRRLKKYWCLLDSNSRVGDLGSRVGQGS
ncbi:hypothetical protein Tco_0535634 [Tanacetum coccineum]